jgi:hypothetical protein
MFKVGAEARQEYALQMAITMRARVTEPNEDANLNAIQNYPIRYIQNIEKDQCE